MSRLTFLMMLGVMALCSAPSRAQDVLSVDDTIATVGGSVDVVVRLTNETEVAGYQIAITYPNDSLEAVGAAIAGLDVEDAVGEPEFFHSVVDPMISSDLGWIVIAVVFDTLPPFAGQTLGAGVDRSIARISFEVTGGVVGDCFLVTPTNGLGSPPISNILSTPEGATLFPILEAGTVCLVDEPRFIRGDANQDEKVDVADGATMLAYLIGVVEPTCLAALDANGDTALNIADPIFLLTYVFLAGTEPPAPFPDCGTFDSQFSCTAFLCP